MLQPKGAHHRIRSSLKARLVREAEIDAEVEKVLNEREQRSTGQPIESGKKT